MRGVVRDKFTLVVCCWKIVWLFVTELRGRRCSGSDTSSTNSRVYCETAVLRISRYPIMCRAGWKGKLFNKKHNIWNIGILWFRKQISLCLNCLFKLIIYYLLVKSNYVMELITKLRSRFEGICLFFDNFFTPQLNLIISYLLSKPWKCPIIVGKLRRRKSG